MQNDQEPSREGAPAAPATRVNPKVPTEELPSISELELEPVAPAFAIYSVLSSALFWLLLAVATVVARELPQAPWRPGPWWPWILFALAAWSALMAWLDARRRAWAVRQWDLVYRSGVLWHRTVIVPFTRIQHVEAISGPLERFFGLTRLKCYTAGGVSADLTVLGLSARNAGRVRQFLLEKIRDDEGPAAGDR